MAAIPAPRNALTVALIRFYQKWISPYKGYRCAHHFVHGQGSCSAYGLEAFTSEPFGQALRLLRQRFRDCRTAYELAMSEAARESEDEPEEESGKRRPRRNSEAFSDCVMLEALGDCGDIAGSIPCDLSMSSCDGMSACDGISGCDGVDACDIGSCH